MPLEGNGMDYRDIESAGFNSMMAEKVSEFSSSNAHMEDTTVAQTNQTKFLFPTGNFPTRETLIYWSRVKTWIFHPYRSGRFISGLVRKSEIVEYSAATRHRKFFHHPTSVIIFIY